MIRYKLIQFIDLNVKNYLGKVQVSDWFFQHALLNYHQNNNSLLYVHIYYKYKNKHFKINLTLMTIYLHVTVIIIYYFYNYLKIIEKK
jgi:hypothetical protein